VGIPLNIMLGVLAARKTLWEERVRNIVARLNAKGVLTFSRHGKKGKIWVSIRQKGFLTGFLIKFFIIYIIYIIYNIQYNIYIIP